MVTTLYIASAILLSEPLLAEFSIGSMLDRLLKTRECAQCSLRGSDLSGLDLSGVNLSGADLSRANLSKANLRGADLRAATLLNVDLSGTLLADANLENANLSSLDIDKVFEYTEIIGAKLEGALFKDGVVCGPPPLRGGWGCRNATE